MNRDSEIEEDEDSIVVSYDTRSGPNGSQVVFTSVSNNHYTGNHPYSADTCCACAK